MALQVAGRGRSLDEIVNGDWYRSLTASPRDLAFSRELAYGFCRWFFALATVLEGRLQKPLLPPEQGPRQPAKRVRAAFQQKSELIKRKVCSM